MEKVRKKLIREKAISFNKFNRRRNYELFKRML